jgi:DNA-binding NtrC family response regulator
MEGDRFTDDFLALSENGNDDIKIPRTDDLYKTLEKIEREMIINALQENKGVKQKTARQLNIKPSTLYYRMEKLNIQDGDYK